MVNEILFEVLTSCNLACEHCYLKNKKSDGLPLTDIFKMIDIIKKGFNPKKIILLGGEPSLLGDKLLSILNYCTSNFESVAVESNGTLPSYFQNYDCTVAVSFESCYKDANDSIRKFANSDKSVYDLAVTKMLAGRRYDNPKVTRITLYNDSDVLASIVFAEKLGSNLIMVPLMKQGCAESLIHRIPNAKKIKEAMEICMEANKRMQGYHQIQIPQWYLANMDLFEKYKGLFEKQRRICSAGVQRLFINYKGDLKPCPFLPQVNFGNLLNDKIKNIEKNINDFNLKIREVEPQGKCKDCDAFKYCGGGCLSKFFKNNKKMGEDCPLIIK